MKRRSILLILCLVLIAALATGLSFAYFTAQQTATNTFTVGSIDIELTEPSWDASAEHVALPGVSFDKDPTVTNTGDNAAWVRLNVTVSDYAAFASEIPAGYDLTQIFGGFDSSKWTLAGAPVVDNDSVTYSYTYNTALEPAANTGALFTDVTIPTFLTGASLSAMGGDFTVTVTADAIQAEGFADAASAFAAFDAQNP